MSLPGRSRALVAAFALLVHCACGGSPAAAETGISKEYQVKAVFLFNFAQFVKWPRKAFASVDEPFQIGILGDDPFDDFLDETVTGEKVDGHPLVVHRYKNTKDIQGCRILFICHSESGRLGDILAGLKGKDILTVGDTEDFNQKGGVVRFVTKENKVRFRINLEAAKGARFTISSKVLRLAEIVGPGKD